MYILYSIYSSFGPTQRGPTIVCACLCVFEIMYRIELLFAGCEFFKEYRDNDYDPEGLQFDWSQVLYL